MQINREEFLSTLESVEPGLSSKETVEQSTCFVFLSGYIYTYNGEDLACKAPSGLPKSYQGGISAKETLDLFRKKTEDEVLILDKESYFLVKSKGGTSKLVKESEIRLPIQDISKPEEWKELPPDFAECIDLVKNYVGKDYKNAPVLTCIHLTPRYIESGDNKQIIRYKIKLNLTQETHVKKDSIKHIVALGMTEFSETPSWLHFRNPGKLSLSCRHYAEDYPDFSPWLQLQGEKLSLSRSVEEAAKRCEIFAGMDGEEFYLEVILNQENIKIIGCNPRGRHTETKKVTYLGEQQHFVISPSILQDIAKKQSECLITEGRLSINGGKWKYVTILGEVPE